MPLNRAGAGAGAHVHHSTWAIWAPKPAVYKPFVSTAEPEFHYDVEYINGTMGWGGAPAGAAAAVSAAGWRTAPPRAEWGSVPADMLCGCSAASRGGCWR